MARKEITIEAGKAIGDILDCTSSVVVGYVGLRELAFYTADLEIGRVRVDVRDNVDETCIRKLLGLQR